MGALLLAGTVSRYLTWSEMQPSRSPAPHPLQVVCDGAGREAVRFPGLVAQPERVDLESCARQRFQHH